MEAYFQVQNYLIDCCFGEELSGKYTEISMYYSNQFNTRTESIFLELMEIP